jgi:hypothetical protein
LREQPAVRFAEIIAREFATAVAPTLTETDEFRRPDAVERATSALRRTLEWECRDEERSEVRMLVADGLAAFRERLAELVPA